MNEPQVSPAQRREGDDDVAHEHHHEGGGTQYGLDCWKSSSELVEERDCRVQEDSCVHCVVI